MFTRTTTCLMVLGFLNVGAAMAADAPALPAEDATPWFSLSSWKGGVEVGLNGSDGNTSTFNARAGFNAARETDKYLTKASFSYKLAQSGSTTTDNKAILDVQNDWKLEKGSPWSIFAKGTLEYNDFTNWDWRAALFGGVGYRLVDEAKTKVNLKAGLGVSREFGGTENAWTPEAILGADASHQISERQKVTASIDLYPALDNFGDYRFIARAAWEMLVDPETKMNLKVGIEDRYDSTPGTGSNRNDLDYFAVLVWSF